MAQKIEMGAVRWVFVILLGCWPLCATQSTCPSNVQQKTICVPRSSHVHVPCPNVTDDKMMFKLFKDQEMITNATCSQDGDALKCEFKQPPPPHAKVAVEVQENRQHKPVSFVLAGLTDVSQGTYSCDGLVIFPPPLKTVPSALRIQVLVEGNIFKCNNGSNRRFDWIWMLGVALLSIYGVVVTIIAVANWVRWRHTESQSDYMNTKPRAQRDCRRKKGVQKPIPRHF